MNRLETLIALALGTVLVATGQILPGADRVEDHQAAHAAEPPGTGSGG